MCSDHYSYISLLDYEDTGDISQDITTEETSPEHTVYTYNYISHYIKQFVMTILHVEGVCVILSLNHLSTFTF